MHMTWDEVQTVEALVRGGSVEAAGRELGLRHSSVSRRIAGLERRLGAALFVRGARLVPTGLARGIAERARGMRAAAVDIEGFVEAEGRARRSSVVVTTTDVLAPLLFRGLARAGLGASIEVLVTDQELELVPGRVDLALRPREAPGGALRGRRLGRLRIGLYRGPGGEEGYVLPSAALREKRSMRWWRELPGDASGAVTCGSLLAMRDACLSGLGRAALPAFLATGDARLRLERELPGGPPLWLLSAATAAPGHELRATTAALFAALRATEGAFA